MKKVVFALCISFFVSMSLVSTFRSTETALENGIIRLHVRANSDSYADQQLKLKVRDRIIKECSFFLKNSDIETARNKITKNYDKIASVASDEIAKNGYNYPVNIKFGKSDFPTRIYNDITLPAGTYEALTVEIGNASGQNWWCVLFPPLCFVDETCTKINDESKNILISNLGEDTYKMLESGDKNIKIRFKIYEMWENGKIKLQTIMTKLK